MTCTFAVCCITFVAWKGCDGRNLPSEGRWQFPWAVSVSLSSARGSGSSALGKAEICVCSAPTPLARQRKGVDVGRSCSSAASPSVRWSPGGGNSSDVWPSKGCSTLDPPGTWGLPICQPGTLVRGSKPPAFIGLLKQPCARCYFFLWCSRISDFSFFSSYFPLSRSCSIYQVTLSFKQNATNMLTLKHAT